MNKGVLDLGWTSEKDPAQGKGVSYTHLLMCSEVRLGVVGSPR